jgi:hypothetical protein
MKQAQGQEEDTSVDQEQEDFGTNRTETRLHLLLGGNGDICNTGWEIGGTAKNNETYSRI